MESIILGGGCFWCLEAAYQIIPGVAMVESGYAGGLSSNPSYKEVCSGNSGHAEVVKVTFDTNLTSLDQILLFFWKIHNPTTLNQQGADRGTQYRSCIFYTTENQKNTAQNQIIALDESGVYEDKIVTEITELVKFYKAEEYHQNYFKNHPEQGYCQLVIGPKMAKLKEILA
jgi:methionine-S-sulfoxide reductase